MNMIPGDIRRELPSNNDAEQALLGALLINNDALVHVPSQFSPAHFYEPLHADIFEAIRKGRLVNKKMNPVTIRSFMSPESVSRKVGDMTVSQYLARLCSEAVSIVNVPDYADAISGFYHRREAMITGEDAQLASINTADELDFMRQIKECANRLNAIITSINERNDPSENFSDAVDGSLDRTCSAQQGKMPIGIDPGIPEITALTGNWQSNQLIIIGGGVKQGKSALAMQCLFNIAERHPVAVNSGEMSRNQLIMREKARRTGISATRQQKGAVSEAEIQELAQAGREMKHLHFIDIDCRRLTLEQHDDKITRLIGEHGIQAYVLDHIGKIQWTGRMEHEDEFKQGQKATSILKDMAQKHGIPIIALTHLKKAAFQDYVGRTFKERVNAAMNRRPTYRDLVGNMDKDADHVLVVFQAKPIIAGMEPAEDSEDYLVWEDAIAKVTGKADIILSLSRESEFPRRKEISWDGKSTSYGPSFKQAMNARELF